MVLLLLSFHLPTSFISGWSTTFTSETLCALWIQKATEIQLINIHVYSHLFLLKPKHLWLVETMTWALIKYQGEIRMRASPSCQWFGSTQTTRMGNPKPHHCSLCLQENLQPCFQCHLAHISRKILLHSLEPYVIYYRYNTIHISESHSL